MKIAEIVDFAQEYVTQLRAYFGGETPTPQLPNPASSQPISNGRRSKYHWAIYEVDCWCGAKVGECCRCTSTDRKDRYMKSIPVHGERIRRAQSASANSSE